MDGDLNMKMNILIITVILVFLVLAYAIRSSVDITDTEINIVGSLNATSGIFNYVDKLEISEPATPPANTLRLYVKEQDGFSRYNYKDEYGVVRTLNDDEIIVKNIRGTTIAKHRLVYVTGHSGGVPTVDLAKADNISTMPVVCVTIESMANNTLGRCMMMGLLEDVNTNAYNIGTIYVSDTTAGIPTNTAPITPNLTQEIGTILVKSATVGEIQIISRALTGDEFGTINDFIVQGNLSTLENLNVSGNITSENVFTHQYLFAHTNETIPLISANVWENITFAQENTYIMKGISHVHNDATNHTFTVSESGVYNIDYDYDLEDTSAAASNINVAGRGIYTNGTELTGSVFEVDLTKQGAEVELSHNFLCELGAGDIIVFQFVADDEDVQISTHGTFGDHPESASILIVKVANL